MHRYAVLCLWPASSVTYLAEDGPNFYFIDHPSPRGQVNGVIAVLSLKQCQALVPSAPARSVDSSTAITRFWRCRSLSSASVALASQATPSQVNPAPAVENVRATAVPAPHLQAEPIDPLYLFACQVAWEQEEEPSAAWELIRAANCGDEETRAHARALLGNSQHLFGSGVSTGTQMARSRKRAATAETDMNTPYDLEIIENCTECTNTHAGFFCGFSHRVLQALNRASQKSTLPAGAILFVEGQAPRGVFIICSGKVNLSTTSHEGKTLILKTAMPGEALGLSAAISGMGYETTAETAMPCQVNFVDRKQFLELMEAHSETGLHTAQSLSRDYHAAYRDIHDLVLTRSSSGKLARLLLSISDQDGDDETSLSLMTHEEIGLRIGASRETVTRLLTKLRKKQLIRLDGPNLVIRDRSGLEALAS